MNGTPMVDTITIANVCRNGKTNNVYRTAIRLAELGEKGIIDLGGRPAKCAVSQSAFHHLASRFYRHKDESTALGVVAINNAFASFMDTIIDDIETQVAETQADQEHQDEPEPKTPMEMAEAFITETNNRWCAFKNMVLDAMRDVILDITADIERIKSDAYKAGVADKQAECDAIRSELDALRRMIKPEPTGAVQPLKGNVSVQQCAAWLTSNGVKDMGEIRLYEWMRGNGLVCDAGTSRNLPTQIALEKGLLVTISNPYTNPRTGVLMNTYTTRITPKGQAYLFNRLMYYQINPKQ